MNSILWFVLSVCLMWFAVSSAFILVAHCKAIIDRGEKLHWIWKAPALIWLVVGLIADVLFNYTAGSVIYRELPKLREPLFTARTKRHFYLGDGWREARAEWWKDQLNLFDEGHV